MKRVLSGILAAMLISGSAAASELVTTAGAAGTPAVQAAGADAPPLGVSRVAHSTVDDRTQAPPSPTSCSPITDGKVHGEVWGGVGTHGYRDVGMAMTGPLGKCGAVSIAVSRTEGAWGRRGR
jgi:hypothetical protein